MSAFAGLYICITISKINVGSYHTYLAADNDFLTIEIDVCHEFFCH